MCYKSIWQEHHEVPKSLLLRENLLMDSEARVERYFGPYYIGRAATQQGGEDRFGEVWTLCSNPRERKERRLGIKARGATVQATRSWTRGLRRPEDCPV